MRPPKQAASNDSSPSRVSLSQLRSIMDDSVIGMSLAAPDGSFVEVNPAFCKIVGYERGEMLRTNFQAITHPDDLRADLNLVRQLLSGELATYEMDKRYVHKRGHPVW